MTDGEDADGRRTYSVDPSHMLAVEDALAESFASDAGLALVCADSAADLLKATLLPVGRRHTTLEVDDETGTVKQGPGSKEVILAAQVLIGARALRLIRAARAVLARGYEAEVGPLDRVLLELLMHRQTIVADETGNEAIAWIERKRQFGLSKEARSNYRSITPEHGRG